MKTLLRLFILCFVLATLSACIPFMYYPDNGTYQQGRYHERGYDPSDHIRPYHHDGSRDNYHRRSRRH